MNDFLSNLIARSRGELSAIRPRLPSLYEPYRRGTNFNNKFEEGVSGAGLMPGSSGLHRKRPEHLAAESSEENRDAFRAPALAGSLLPRRGAWRTSNAAGPDRAGASSKDKWSSLEPSSTPPIAAGKSSDETFEPETPENWLTETRVQAEPPGKRLRLNQDRTTARSSSLSSDLPSPLDSGNLTSVTPIGAMTVRSQPSAGALRSARSEVDWSQHRPQRSTPLESPINITIGRVEVWAIMPAPPARRAVPAKRRATLSLDDYLKQRDRGRQ